MDELDVRQKLKMAINTNTIDIAGWVLVWLGVVTCIGGFVLYLAVCGGIALGGESHDLHQHDTYFIMINGLRRLIFLLPLAAGFILLASGISIRTQLPFLNAMFTAIPDQNQEAEQDAPSNR